MADKGMTMVEIIVAFAMLLLCVGMLMGCVKFASNLFREATDRDRENSRVSVQIGEELSGYKGYDLPPTGSVVYSFENGAFKMELNKAKVTTEDGRSIIVFTKREE